MAETQTTVNAPLNGTNTFAITQVTWDGVTADIQPFTLRDPITAAGASVTASNALRVDGSAVTQPVSLTNGPYQNSSGTGVFPPSADASAPINITTATTTQIIAGVSGQSIRITGIFLDSNGTGTVELVHGASNTPLTGQVIVNASGGMNFGGALGAIYTLPAGDNFSIITTGSATAQGSVSYTVY